jgi:hypothetical protein
LHVPSGRPADDPTRAAKYGTHTERERECVCVCMSDCVRVYVCLFVCYRREAECAIMHTYHHKCGHAHAVPFCTDRWGSGAVPGRSRACRSSRCWCSQQPVRKIRTRASTRLWPCLCLCVSVCALVPVPVCGVCRQLEAIVREFSSQSTVIAIDRLFTATGSLSGQAVVHFVRCLCAVSLEEVELVPKPRMFSLQKVRRHTTDDTCTCTCRERESER